MAEIPIERKHHAAIWPWIILAIIILLLLWWWASHRSRDDQMAATRADTSYSTGTVVAPATGVAAGAATAPGIVGSSAAAGAASTTGAAGAASPAVTDYVNWVSAAAPNRDEAAQHAYTAGGIRRLADALAAVGASGATLDRMRSEADSLQNSSPTSTHHADMARAAFAAAVDAFNSLKASHPNLDASKVQSAARAMKPGAHLLDQKDTVQNFFDAARDALQGMNT